MVDTSGLIFMSTRGFLPVYATCTLLGDRWYSGFANSNIRK